MNRSDIVSRVAAQSSLSRAAADGVVNAVFTAIGDGLTQDEAVAIAGFGTFSIKKRPARAGRNPRARGASSVASFSSHVDGFARVVPVAYLRRGTARDANARHPLHRRL